MSYKTGILVGYGASFFPIRCAIISLIVTVVF